MITKDDLLEAIAECQGARNPNANTCIKLASYYTILEHLGSDDEVTVPEQNYSYLASNEATVGQFGESEFAMEVSGRNSAEMWVVMDDLMTTLRVINPRLYASVIRKIRGEG